MSDRKPNWNKWKLVPNAMVLQVAALSLDIDPDKVEYEVWGKGLSVDGYIHASELQCLKDRIEVIVANVSFERDDLLYAISLNATREYCGINIAKFAKWALSKKLDIPSELAQLA